MTAQAGSVHYTLDTGKKPGPFNAVLNIETSGNYLDVTKGSKDYPTKLDFGKLKKVKGITFKPGVGSAVSWSSWTYYNNGQWAVDRFTNLS